MISTVSSRLVDDKYINIILFTNNPHLSGYETESDGKMLHVTLSDKREV